MAVLKYGEGTPSLQQFQWYYYYYENRKLIPKMVDQVDLRHFRGKFYAHPPNYLKIDQVDYRQWFKAISRRCFPRFSTPSLIMRLQFTIVSCDPLKVNFFLEFWSSSLLLAWLFWILIHLWCLMVVWWLGFVLAGVSMLAWFWWLVFGVLSLILGFVSSFLGVRLGWSFSLFPFGLVGFFPSVVSLWSPVCGVSPLRPWFF